MKVERDNRGWKVEVDPAIDRAIARLLWGIPSAALALLFELPTRLAQLLSEVWPW